MGRRGGAMSRSEISDRARDRQSDLQEHAEQLESDTADIETVRDTLDSLENAGTTDGADAVTDSITSAENEGVAEFDTESDQLDDDHREVEDDEGDLNDRSSSVEADLGRISDASARVASRDVNHELADAKMSAMGDIDYLERQEHDERAMREESERLQQAMEARVNGRTRT